MSDDVTDAVSTGVRTLSSVINIETVTPVSGVPSAFLPVSKRNGLRRCGAGLSEAGASGDECLHIALDLEPRTIPGLDVTGYELGTLQP